MIHFEKKILSNGLRVIVHHDPTTPLLALNVIYDVGSRDEDPAKTGFAHLFEHLMFGGSVNIPNFDEPLQRVGGENNAFTTNDITNYYLTLPSANIETGLWLESDRMLQLDFNLKNLENQKSVVIEEFKQRNLNQPYGDVFSLVRNLSYQVHPYQWATIGKEISHIENASLGEVEEFFYKFYAPNNAVLVLSGNVQPSEAFRLTEKWFGDIPSRPVPVRDLPVEPKQYQARFHTVQREVPYDALYLAFHMGGKLDANYYATDLISDLLSNGESSRLFRRLLMEKGLFGEIDAYISGDNDPGLFIIAGKLAEGACMEQAESEIWKELELLGKDSVSETELQKVINKAEANLLYSEISFLNKAIGLAAFELLGDADLINEQAKLYRSVTLNQVKQVARNLFRKENCSTLYYLKKEN